MTKNVWDDYWDNKDFTDVRKNPLFNDVVAMLPKKDALILEAGCGNGDWLFYLKKSGYKKIVGLDFSDMSLKKVRTMDKNIMLIKGDIRNLPIKEKCFDSVLSFGVIEHFQKPQRLITEMYRVIKNNGNIFLDTPNTLSLHTFYRFYRRIRGTWVVGYEDSYTPKKLTKMIRKAGFKVLNKGTRGRYGRLDIFGFLSFVVAKK
jgi:ubiquinone/menaquinone biosynthesis C-methylase UbiE